MRDVLGSNLLHPAIPESSLAAALRTKASPRLEAPQPAARSRARTIVLTLATCAALFLLTADAAVAGSNTIPAGAIGYLTLSLTLFACACSFWTRARSAQGTLHLRWSFIAAAALAASIGYFPSFLEGIPGPFHIGPTRQFQTAFFNSSEALYMLAAVLFFANVARSIVIVDILQALLFVVLRFHLIYSPIQRDHFTLNHLIVGQFVALFLFIIATVACLGAASRADLKFLRTLSWFFGFRLIGFFLSNQVSFTWLHYTNCSLLDLPGVTLYAGFALYLLYTDRAANTETPDTTPLHPSLLVRSLMPSFLALVNLMLGLFLLQISVVLAAVAISASVLCYVVRTVLLQAHVLEDKALLETRNQQLEGLVVRDPLTGIGNRRSLANTYARLCTPPCGKDLSLLLMDIDCFKQANDCHGHLHGDKVLILLARQLETLSETVAGSHCARLGGDEFTLLLPDVSPQIAAALAENLRMLFSEHANHEVHSRMSLSIGIASLQTTRDLPLETIVSAADEALYRAKLLGRNRVEIQPMPIAGTNTIPTLHPDLHHITH